MKRVFSALLVLVMVLALAGCGGKDIDTSGGGSSGGNTGDSFNSGDSNTGDSSGDSDSNSGSSSGELGFYEGRIGDTLSTYWFDFTVNDAYLCSEFGGYTPSAGSALLVVDVTLRNTFTASVTMWDIDFQVQWGGEGEDDYALPVLDTDINSDEVLPSEYDIGIGREQSGLLVFEVPDGMVDFSFSYQELFDDGSEYGREGDLFAIFFTAENETDL